MKQQAVIRQIKTLNVACDSVGNILLVKFTCHDAKDICVYFPSDVVFWLLEHIPPLQDRSVLPPPEAEPFRDEHWDERFAPRVLSVNCKEQPQALAMTMEMDRGPYLTAILDVANLELLRRFFVAYSANLINLDA